MGCGVLFQRSNQEEALETYNEFLSHYSIIPTFDGHTFPPLVGVLSSCRAGILYEDGEHIYAVFSLRDSLTVCFGQPATNVIQMELQDVVYT